MTVNQAYLCSNKINCLASSESVQRNSLSWFLLCFVCMFLFIDVLYCVFIKCLESFCRVLRDCLSFFLSFFLSSFFLRVFVVDDLFVSISCQAGVAGGITCFLVYDRDFVSWQCT